LASYLERAGWRVARSAGQVAFWEKHVDGGVMEILQPLDRDLRDYALRIADAVVTLAAEEGRWELEVLQSISAAGSPLRETDRRP
jgi:hypothetical protein